MGISGQKRGIFGDFREKWRAETGKHRTSSMESSEVSATNIRCFMQRSPVFSPPRTLNFFGYAAKKCTFPPYSDGEIYTKLSNEFKIAGIIWFRGVAKKHSHGLHGLYSCRLPSGWVVTTTGTTRRIRPTPQDRNAPNGVYTASP